MMFLFGALRYTICTMKAPHQAARSFCWEGPRCKTMCYAVLFLLITVCISLIIPNAAGNRVVCTI